MLNTTKIIGFAINSKKTKSKADGSSMVSNSVIGGGEITNQINLIKRKNQAKKTKFKILVKSKNRDFPPNFKNMEARSGFLIPETRLVFTQLKQAFIETLILQHFDAEYHILIEIDTSKYAIDEIFN